MQLEPQIAISGLKNPGSSTPLTTAMRHTSIEHIAPSRNSQAPDAPWRRLSRWIPYRTASPCRTAAATSNVNAMRPLRP